MMLSSLSLSRLVRPLLHRTASFSSRPPSHTVPPLSRSLDSSTSNDFPPLSGAQVEFPSELEQEKQHKKQQAAQRAEDKRLSPSLLDDSDHSVLLFPGQGSEFVGMAVALAEEMPSVNDMFSRASQLLGYDLLHVCREGPAETLHSTLYSQPAVVVASLAAVEKLYSVDPKAVESCIATAGFSVGEITALIFSGALTFDDGIKLVKIRAEAMQHSSDMEPSGMLSVFFGANHKLGLGTNAAIKWARQKHAIEDPTCQVANFLYSGGKVIAGHNQCLDFIEENASDFYLRRTRRLPVSGAFHTPLMVPALPAFKAALAATDVHKPRIPIYSNFEARVITTADQIRKTLPRQIVSSVRWEQTMVNMFDYDKPELMPRTFECGPGKGGLSAILKKVKGTAAKKAQYVGV